MLTLRRKTTRCSAWTSQLLLKGMTFQEIASETGDNLLSVQFDFPPADVWILRNLPGMEDYDNS
eukprot:12527332-Prorocentrum_lima.AAC.1